MALINNIAVLQSIIEIESALIKIFSSNFN